MFSFTKVMLGVAVRLYVQEIIGQGETGKVENPKGKPTITTFLNQNNL